MEYRLKDKYGELIESITVGSIDELLELAPQYATFDAVDDAHTDVLYWHKDGKLVLKAVLDE